MRKEFIKTETVDLNGHVLTKAEKAHEERIDKDRYWLDRHEKLWQDGVKAKPEHYALGAVECCRRADYCKRRHLSGYKHDVIIKLYWKKDDGTTEIEETENYSASTWNKINLFRCAAQYWSSIAHQVQRKEELENPLHMHVEHKDIIITDPCYIAKEWDKFYNKYITRPVSRLDVPADERCNNENILMRDTIYGDWSCHVFNEKNESIGSFCADAGMVCIAVLGENPDIDPEKVKEISKKDWCATILKDYTGDLYIKRAPTEGSYDEIYVEGVGSINFTSRQTGL
jgi:hypothetical protein